MAKKTTKEQYTKKDFSSDQAVRWCPGCGDFSILAQMQRVMPKICHDLQLTKEEVVFFSGIGCASRFPYYMDTYGFHTIHGRAPTFATGLKMVKPELLVWVVSGDGDCLSIGGNHLLHCLRRNVDIKIILVNNRIYGLTKGQYSPTSEIGKLTGSSPFGTIDRPINPLLLALSAQASFVGRALDTDSKGLQELLEQAALHKGSAFIEIFQNCNVFNDLAFEHISGKKNDFSNTINIKHGEKLLFGENNGKCLTLSVANGSPKLTVADTDVTTEKDILIHDETDEGILGHLLLAQMEYPQFPIPMGIVRKVQKDTYEALANRRNSLAIKERGIGNLENLLSGEEHWTVT